MPRIESSKRRYAKGTSKRYKAWLAQQNRKKRKARAESVSLTFNGNPLTFNGVNLEFSHG